jgi:hypothetical protein
LSWKVLPWPAPGEKPVVLNVGIMLRIFKWSHWIIRHVNSMRIRQKFKADCCILQIVFSVVFYYPWTFYPGIFFREIFSVVEIREYYIFSSSPLKTILF